MKLRKKKQTIKKNCKIKHNINYIKIYLYIFIINTTNTG